MPAVLRCFYMRRPIRFLLYALVTVSVVLLAGEGVARWLGVADFPIYIADQTIGFVPAAGQSGSFHNNGIWHFNNLGMGTPVDFPTGGDRQGVLLLGDSIVFGNIDQPENDRLYARIEKDTGLRIWPASSGGWALQNEIEYVRRNETVLDHVERIVIVLNSGDFGKPASWRSQINRPTHQPLSYLWYAIRREFPRKLPPQPADMVVARKDPVKELAWLLGRTNVPVDIVLYPRARELGGSKVLDKWQAILTKQFGDRIRVFQVLDIPGWSADNYKDHSHPNGRGRAMLARFIAGLLKAPGNPKS